MNKISFTFAIAILFTQLSIGDSPRLAVSNNERFDIFPLAQGVHYQYEYFFSETSYYIVTGLQYIYDDSGLVEHVIKDSLLTNNNKISWLVEQRIKLLRHAKGFYPHESDTSYWIIDTTYFNLNESTLGNHELTFEPPLFTPLSDPMNIWNFPSKLSSSNPISVFRYADSSDLQVVNFDFDSSDSLWFNDRVGLHKRIFSWNYLGHHFIESRKKITLKKFTIERDDGNHDLPSKYQLFQNYPNPFNSQTVIRYRLPKKSFVFLKVFDVQGRELRRFNIGFKEPGTHEFRLDASAFPSSDIYFFQLDADKTLLTRKAICIK